MITVYRQDFPITDGTRANFPQGAELLTVAASARLPDGITVWYRCNTDAPMVERTLHIRGTGHPDADCGTYLGTVQFEVLFFHVFDGGETA